MPGLHQGAAGGALHMNVQRAERSRPGLVPILRGRGPHRAVRCEMALHIQQLLAQVAAVAAQVAQHDQTVDTGQVNPAHLE